MPSTRRSATQASLPADQAGSKRSRQANDDSDKSVSSGPISRSQQGAPVIGLHIHKAGRQPRWLGEGEAFVIGRSLTGLVLPADLPGDLQIELFFIDDPAMFAMHAILWVTGGRPYVLCLRQGEEPTGDRRKLSAQRDGEKSWFSIGEGSRDELHRNVTYIRASKATALVVDWDAKTLLHTSRLAATKRAIVRIGVYSKTKSCFLAVGSGVVIAGPANLHFAQVLSCAHTLFDTKEKLPDKTTPNPSFMKLYSAADDVVIVVAEYVSDEACEWRYLAKVVTPEPLLSETVAPPAGKSGSWLNDLAVLQLVAPLEITPALYQSPVASHSLGTVQPDYTAAAPCPLRGAGLELAQVHTAQVASSFGWMSEYGEKALSQVLEYKIKSQNNGWLEYDGPLDSGGSGGPVVGADGRVLAINSRSIKLPGSGPNKNINRSFSRSVSKLKPGHGLL